MLLIGFRHYSVLQVDIQVYSRRWILRIVLNDPEGSSRCFKIYELRHEISNNLTSVDWRSLLLSLETPNGIQSVA